MDKELKEYLEGRFDRIDERFDSVEGKLQEHDKKFEEHDDKFDDLKRHFGVVAEDLIHKIDQLAELVALNGEKIERLEVEIKKDMKEMKEELGAMIKFSYADLDKKIISLDMRGLNLEERVNRIESH